MMKLLPFLAVILFMAGCQSRPLEEKSSTSHWIAQLQISDSVSIPVTFEWQDTLMLIRNGKEVIEVREITEEGDSTLIHFPVFQAGWKVYRSENNWQGYWEKYDTKEPYRVPLIASVQNSQNLSIKRINEHKLANRFKVEFEYLTEESSWAIGEFTSNEMGEVEGTFRTQTGDYRFLSGTWNGVDLDLSTFDGTHAYLFKAKFISDTLFGVHYSGKTYAEAWRAWPNDTFQLKDPEGLSRLSEGISTIQFEVIDPTSGELFRFDSKETSGPVLIQIMGSWCPNCMDESVYFNELYSLYHERGLRIIGLTFERSDDLKTSLPAIAKMMKDIGIQYPVYFAGRASSERVSTVLPHLENFMSYPTSILINARGEVVRIHTGFDGPGTRVYSEYTEKTQALIESLLEL